MNIVLIISGSIAEFDAIMFHIPDMKEDNKPMIELPKIRKPHQRYVMFYMESPSHNSFPFNEFNNFFNWTMT